MTRKLVFDTDLGSDVDDALALALGLASPELEIVAITCVGNEAERRARAARKLLGLAGRDDIPVHAGCRVPLLAGRGFNWGVIEQAQHLIFRAIDKAKGKYAVDDRRVVITGFSQGGTMSFVVALRFPDRFVGVIPMPTVRPRKLTSPTAPRILAATA